MSGILVAMQGAVAQGVLWGIMVLGVYITYRLLDIADLTVDGSFALGGCVINFDLDPLAALLLSMLAGMAAGAVTGILHTVLEIPAILAGILTQISLWSINLRIMSGKSNLPLLKLKTLISSVGDSLGITQAQASILVGVAAAVLIVAVLYWFFGTEIGSALRATGNNEDMIRALGVNVAWWGFPEPWCASTRNMRISTWAAAPSSSAWLPLSSARCSWDGSLTLPAS